MKALKYFAFGAALIATPLQAQDRYEAAFPFATPFFCQAVMSDELYIADVDQYNETDYVPNIGEFFAKPGEDCDGYAVKSSTLLRENGYVSFMVAGFTSLTVTGILNGHAGTDVVHKDSTFTYINQSKFVPGLTRFSQVMRECYLQYASGEIFEVGKEGDRNVLATFDWDEVDSLEVVLRQAVLRQRVGLKLELSLDYPEQRVIENAATLVEGQQYLYEFRSRLEHVEWALRRVILSRQ